jgi:L-lysine exporter family protein LysE/ArgO
VFTSLLAGLLTGLSLIVAIGAQNAFVLRQGINRLHVGMVVSICAVSDLLLIIAGVSGIGALVDNARWVIDLARWLGVAFLTWYALSTLRKVLRPSKLTAEGVSPDAVESRRQIAIRAAALTWLNPHVYLDTVLLIGSIAAAHNRTAGGRWAFAAGAASASILWFASLGYGARLLTPFLTSRRAWQFLDTTVAGTMVFVATKLALA